MSEQDAPHDAIVGSGPFPPELDRLNWNALIWNALWAMTYGLWPWFWGFAILRFGGLALVTNLNRATSDGSLVWTLAIAVSWFLMNWGVSALFAFRANRLLWERRQHGASTSSPLPLAKFQRTQRTWALIGLAVFVVVPFIPPYALATSTKVTLVGVPLFFAAMFGVDRLRVSSRQS